MMELLEYKIVVFGAALLSIGITYLIAFRKREEHRKDLQEQHKVRTLESTTDAVFVLYLRDFDVDETPPDRVVPLKFGGVAMVAVDSFEYELKKQVKAIGPVLCIGDPENKEEKIGGVRYYYSNAEWQNAALEKMKKAELILFRPSSSDGTFWEFEQLLSLGYLTKTILVASKDDFFYYNKFRQKTKDLLPELPDMKELNLFIEFDKDLNGNYANRIKDIRLFNRLFLRYKKDAF